MKKLILLLPFFVTLLYNCSNPPAPIEKKTEILANKTAPSKATLEHKIKTKLGEGAIWNHQTQEFFWVDIEGRLLHIYNPKTKKNRSFPTPSRIGTVVPSGKETAIIALEDGMYSINTITGDIELFTKVESDQPENRFNDGKCDPAGRLWVGSMHLEQITGRANLYRIDPDGTATKMLDSITISNGIVWTKDQKTMYYIDTPTGHIQGYDYEVNTGTISNERIAVEVPTALGYPDGMTIDENDMLWVGLWNGNAVANFNPLTGKLIRKIEVPAHNVTACAFGGENLDLLYITTASVDMTAEEMTEFPDAGSVFVAKPGVKGLEAWFFGK